MEFGVQVQNELRRFHPELPIEEADTPPSTWYTSEEFYRHEIERVFKRSWQPVARLDQLENPGDFVGGCLAGEPYLITRGSDQKIRAFFNVCRHHASRLVMGAGRAKNFVCPYHGWTYELDGTLKRAPGLDGIKRFDPDQNGLTPLVSEVWGPWVFVNFSDPEVSLVEFLSALGTGFDQEELKNLQFVKRKSYTIDCNWKVFVDNYLDGGYHVPRMHQKLASGLDIESYSSEVFENLSIQYCRSKSESQSEEKDRLGKGAAYAWIYPNLMINRYGPMMDTNWVVPKGVSRTEVVFDYYFERDGEGAPDLKKDLQFLEESLKSSDQVQREDIFVCDAVQQGLASRAYQVGRYAPKFERPMYSFHQKHFKELV